MRPKEYENKELLEKLQNLSEVLPTDERVCWLKTFYDIVKDEDVTGIIKSFEMMEKLNFGFPGVEHKELKVFKQLLFNDAWFKKRCNDIKKKDIEQDFE